MIYLTQVPAGMPRAEQGKVLHRAAWALLRLALAERAPGLALEGNLAFGPHGKPYLPEGPCFSLAHTRGLALCAVEGWEVGVDAEYRRGFPPKLRGRVFTLHERDFAARSPDPDGTLTTIWTLKESYMKFTGEGLGLGPGRIGFSFVDGRPVLEGSGACFQYTNWEGWHIAQCGPRPFQLELHPVPYHSLPPAPSL